MDECGGWKGACDDWTKGGIKGMAAMFYRNVPMLSVCEVRQTLLFVVPPEQRMYASQEYMAKFERLLYDLFKESWRIVVYVGRPVFGWVDRATADPVMGWMLMPAERHEYRYQDGR